MPGNIATPPPSVYASWPPPNYEDPERRIWLPPVAGTLHGVATVLIAARLWLRSKRPVGGLGLDDAFLVPAWLFATAGLVMLCYASANKFCGVHTWDVPPTVWWEVALNAWLSQLFFLIGTCCLKVSVLVFCLRMVDGTWQRRWRWAILGVIAFTVAWTLALTLVLIANCHPVKAYWMAFDIFWAASHEYHCADTRILNPLSGALAILSDMYSIAIPCIVCWDLRISRRQRLGLNILFGASVMAIGAAGGRTWALWKVGQNYDAAWHSTWVFFWSSFEFALGLICTCIPTLRALFKSGITASRGDSARRSRQEPYVSSPESGNSLKSGSARSVDEGRGSTSRFARDIPKQPSVASTHVPDESWIELGERQSRSSAFT